MKHYFVDVVLRDERGQELRRLRPAWQGEAEDPGAALRASDDIVREHVRANARIQAIGLQVRGQGGLELSTTEYPEDYLVGRGTSADQSRLAADNFDPGLTPEQLEEARRVRAARALAALPQEMREGSELGGQRVLEDFRKTVKALEEDHGFDFTVIVEHPLEGQTFGQECKHDFAAGGIVTFDGIGPDEGSKPLRHRVWETPDGRYVSTYGDEAPPAGGVLVDDGWITRPAVQYVLEQEEDSKMQRAREIMEEYLDNARRAYLHGLPGVTKP